MKYLSFIFLLSFVQPVSADSFPGVVMQHNDLARTGANVNETILTTANVNGTTFGKLFSRSVDGQIYTQPLYVPAIAIPGQGFHNVIYVATEHNSVYAFDADSASASAPLWTVNLGTPVLCTQTPGCDRDIKPEIGITSTPVIDLSSGTIFLVAETFENNAMVFRIHALDLTTGTERSNSPAVIGGSVNGTGVGSSNGVLAFNPALHWQRPGLVLWNGSVYVGFGSHQDTEPYHGWVFGFDKTTLKVTALRCLSPNAEGAGVWLGGVAPAVDAQGNMYVQTGHGKLDYSDLSQADLGISIVKINIANGLLPVDFFAPSNQPALSNIDSDFGSSGAVLLPGTPYVVGGGKDGKIFLMDTNNLGKFDPNADHVLQYWQATYSLFETGSGGIFGGIVWYNSTLYVWGRRDVLKAFQFNGTQFNTTPVSQTTFAVPDGYSTEPAMSLSANGTTPGTAILWASYPLNGKSDGAPYAGVLYAFDASNLSKPLWTSTANPADNTGSWAKWVSPTVANGKVYLASFDKVLNVYGLLPVAGTGGVLTESATTSAATMNLTQEGQLDWIAWGGAATARKAAVTPQISDYSVVGGGKVIAYPDDLRALSWTDGVAPATTGNSKSGLDISGIGNGFSLTVPADEIQRTLTVHVGGWNSSGTLIAHLSDGSAADETDTSAMSAGQYDRNYTFTYSAASAGQTLRVSWVLAGGTGKVNLNGAALNPPGAMSTSGTASLNAAGTGSNASTSLSGEGASDWVHWGDATLTRKAGVSALISNYVVVGTGTVLKYTNDPRPLTWSDGTPTATGNNKNGIYISKVGNGFSLNAPAGLAASTIVVHVGGWYSGGTFTAHLSDGSAPDFKETTATATGQYDRNYTITYSAATAGQTLKLSWVMASGTGNVTLNAAGLNQ